MTRIVGKTLVAWMVEQGLAPDKETAVKMGQAQLERGRLLSSGYSFQNARIFYQLSQVFGTFVLTSFQICMNRDHKPRPVLL